MTLLFPKDSESLDILNIPLQEVGQKDVKTVPLKVNTQTNIWTNQLIESIGPEILTVGEFGCSLAIMKEKRQNVLFDIELSFLYLAGIHFHIFNKTKATQLRFKRVIPLLSKVSKVQIIL